MLRFDDSKTQVLQKEGGKVAMNWLQCKCGVESGMRSQDLAMWGEVCGGHWKVLRIAKCHKTSHFSESDFFAERLLLHRTALILDSHFSVPLQGKGGGV